MLLKMPSYLKKSSLQYTSLSFTKHLSFSDSLHFAHFKHFECQFLSNTFNMNRSKIKRPHPVHFGIAAEIKNIYIVSIPVQNKVKQGYIQGLKFSALITYLQELYFEIIGLKVLQWSLYVNLLQYQILLHPEILAY